MFFFISNACIAQSKVGEVLWYDVFEDEDSEAQFNVGWIYYPNDVVGQIVKQENGELFLQNGIYAGSIGCSLVETNGSPNTTREAILKNSYDQPNHLICAKIKFKKINSPSTKFLVITRMEQDTSRTPPDSDPTVSPAYVLLIEPLLGNVAIAKYNEDMAILSPESWKFFAQESFDFKLDTYYQLKFYLFEGYLKCKIWRADTQEPINWLIECIDPLPRVQGKYTAFAEIGAEGDQYVLDDIYSYEIIPDIEPPGGNGTKEIVGNEPDAITLVKVKGNRYQMGWWYGYLLAEEIANCWNGLKNAMGYSEETYQEAINAAWSSEYFNIEEYNNELQGIADGCEYAGHPEVTFSELIKFHMVPEISEHGCSFYSVWGKATANNHLYQMRNLDWHMHTGIQNYPVVTIYEPDDGYKHANIGFAGMIGVIAGMNENGIALSEVGSDFGDAETLYGIPFPFLFRDILYYDLRLSDGLSRIQNATRTNQYHYCICDSKINGSEARVLLTSNSRCEIYDDQQWVDLNNTQLKDLVYYKNTGGGNEVIPNAIKEQYGNIDSSKAIEIAKITSENSTVMSVVYDATTTEFWVAYANGNTSAKEQEYIHFEPLSKNIRTDRIIYVDEKNNTGIEDGTREYPFNTIQEGIDTAVDGDTILVAAGIYTEDISIEKSIYLRGNGPDSTIIQAPHSSSAISIKMNSQGPTIEGFRIQNATNVNQCGIGIRDCSPIIRNNVIINNWNGIWAVPTSSPFIINNVLSHNEFNISILESSPTVKNNIIIDGKNSGIYAASSSLNINYNDVWNNTNNYSGDAYPGENDISENPLFVNPDSNDYHLLMGSPCIDAGDPNPAYNDLDGTRNDMGAYGGPNGESYEYKIFYDPTINNSKVRSRHWVGGDFWEGWGIDLWVNINDPQGLDDIDSVWVEGPNNTHYKLYDDGRHNDDSAGDGKYAHWIGGLSNSPALGVYTFKVIDKSGNMASVVDILTAVLDYPRNLTPGHNEIVSLPNFTIDWDNVEGASWYEVQVTNMDWSKTYWSSGRELTQTVVEYNFDGTGEPLSEGGVYLLTVRAGDSYGNESERVGVRILYRTNAGSSTIYVDCSNISGVENGTLLNPFNTIQEALDVTNPGDTVRVAAGTYEGRINDVGSIALIGEDPSSTIIKGYVALRSTNVTIRGFTITRSDRTGIEVHGNVNAIISNNVIVRNSGGGIAHGWSGSSSSIITNNTIVDNVGWGIRVELPGSHVIAKNNIITNHKRGGIFQYTTGIIIENSYNCYWENGSTHNIETGLGEIFVNPRLASFKKNDYHLQLGSPCIDAGDPDPLLNDINDSRNDMGAFGGPAGSFYTYVDGPPVVEKVITNPGYLNPGESVIISAKVWDVIGQVSFVHAEIESPDETNQAIIQLFDDGVHNDGAAGDHTYGNTWTTLSTPMNYVVDIIAADNNSNSDTLDNAALFSTDESTLPHQLTTNLGSDASPSITQTSDGKIWVVWSLASESGYHLWYQRSNIGGQTWTAPQQLTFEGGSNLYPSIAQAADGTIWVVYQRDDDIWYKTSDNNGSTWSSDAQLTTDSSRDLFPRLAADSNGKLVLTWSSFRTGWDVYYKVSLDNGNNWTPDMQLTTNPGLDLYSAVTIDSVGEIHVVWSSRSFTNWDVWYSYSRDNGASWSAPNQVTTDFDTDYFPSIDIDYSGKILMAWVSYRTGNADIFYSTSPDGIVWSLPAQLTRFTGYDSRPDISVVSGKPWIVWSSDRAVNYDIWVGILGQTLDSNPPPHADWVTHDPYSPAPTPQSVITIKAKVTDEAAVESVQIVYSVNDQAQGNLAMYDDGNHNDDAAGDDIWGVRIGPYPAGTIITYQVRAQDIAGNTILAPQEPAQAEVMGPFVQTTNLLLVGDYKSNYSDWLLPYYTNALDTNGYAYDVWDCFLRGEIDSSTLNNYKKGAVIWFTPYWDGYIFNNTTQNFLQNYLDLGGKLFITGQEIGYSLKDAKFYSDYLHAQFVQEVDIDALKGVEGDPITDGLTIFIIGGDGADNQWMPDEIAPISPAVSIFNYGLTSDFSEQRKILMHSKRDFFQKGIRIETPELFESEDVDPLNLYSPTSRNNSIASSGSGALRVDTGTYKVVYFAFGFEAINNAADRAFIMYSVLKWLSPSSHEAGILFVNPDQGNNLGSITVTIHGFGFQQGATVKLVKSGYQDIFGTETTVVDSGKIITSFNLTGAALGKWDVVVGNGYNKDLTLPSSFNIDVGSIKPFVDVIGRNQVRVGREITYYINTGNSGNSTATELMCWIILPEGVNWILESEDDTIGTGEVKLIIPNEKLLSNNVANHKIKKIEEDKYPEPILILFDKMPPSSERTMRLLLKRWQPPEEGWLTTKIMLDYAQQQPTDMSEVLFKPLADIMYFRLHSQNYPVTKEEMKAYLDLGWQQAKAHSWAVHLKKIMTIALDTYCIAHNIPSYTLSPEEYYQDWAIANYDAQIIENYLRSNKIEKLSQVVNSIDPNEKAGPSGFGLQNFVLSEQFFKYIIYFENVDSATAAAQEVMILDTLENSLNWTSFRFNDIQFGENMISMSDSNTTFSANFRLNDTTEVQIRTTFDPQTGIARWYLRGTDLRNADYADFLPPNKKSPEGEGHVSFTIKPKQNLFSGAQIINKASIIFDMNPPMKTNEVVNTIDALPPSSSITSITVTESPLQFELSWTGNDEQSGSGLKDYTIYYSDNGSAYKSWFSNTSVTSDIFIPEKDHVYRFYSIARDSVGNIETQPDSFDVKVTLGTPVETDDSQPVPTEFSLYQNYPNPFNPETTIQYQLPKASKVVLEIYNILGQRVRTLVDEKKEVGYYKVIWDSRNDFGLPVGSGVYLFRLKADEFIAAKKAVVLK